MESLSLTICAAHYYRVHAKNLPLIGIRRRTELQMKPNLPASSCNRTLNPIRTVAASGSSMNLSRVGLPASNTFVQ